MLPSAEMRSELKNLESERDSGGPGEYMADAFNRMGREKYERFLTLRKFMVDPVNFTDTVQGARDAAGVHRFLIQITIPDIVARAHRTSFEEIVVSGEKPAVGQNFAFTGAELDDNQKEWNLTVRDLILNPI